MTLATRRVSIFWRSQELGLPSGQVDALQVWPCGAPEVAKLRLEPWDQHVTLKHTIYCHPIQDSQFWVVK